MLAKIAKELSKVATNRQSLLKFAKRCPKLPIGDNRQKLLKDAKSKSKKKVHKSCQKIFQKLHLKRNG